LKNPELTFRIFFTFVSVKAITNSVLALCLTLTSAAQNLVPNPSFESFNVCNGFNLSTVRFNIPTVWYTPINFNVPHYFNACANATMQQLFGGVPANTHGNQSARTGVAYAAISTYQTSPTCEFRQYIQTQLTQTLLAGQEVYFEMWVSLCDNSQLASDGLQVTFTNNRLRPSDTVSYNMCSSRLNVTPQISNPQNNIITDAAGWTKVSGTFTAAGGENWITIGNFKSNSTTGGSATSVSGTGTFARADYYIDDVMVTVCSNLPQRVLPNDTNFCGASLPLNFQLNAFAPGVNNYLWNNGHTGSTLTAVFPGTYAVRLTSGSCILWDTIVVQNTPRPTVNLGADRNLCQFTPTTLTPVVTNTQSYRWQNNATTPSLVAFFPGIYWVEVSSGGGCRARDSVLITQSPSPNIQLPDTSELCTNTSLLLNAYFAGATYLWSNGQTDSVISTTQTGKLWVTVNNNGCIRSDTTLIIRNTLSESQLQDDTLVCANTTLKLSAQITGAQSYLWNNGTSDSTLVATQPGKYWIKATRGNCSVSDTININWKPNPIVQLGNDTTICSGATLTIDAGNPGATYLWNTNKTTRTEQANATGLYKVNVNKDGCSSTDSIFVFVEPRPQLDLGTDTTLCQGASITLNAACSGCAYLWNNGSTLPTLLANQNGQYKVAVRKGSCNLTDSIVLTVQPIPQVNLGSDFASCFNEPLVLEVADTFNAYLWNDGTLTYRNTIVGPGTYWVSVTHGLCQSFDTVHIEQLPLPVKPLGNDRKICLNTTAELNALNSGSNYLWDDNSTNAYRNVIAPGLYWVKITNAQGCIVVDSIELDTFTRTDIKLANDTFYCENSAVELVPSNDFVVYTWSTGASSKSINVSTAGTYNLRATDVNGCINEASVNVNKRAAPVALTAKELKVCEPAFDFYATPGMKSYLWNNGTTQPVLYISSYGKYEVTVTDTFGCTGTSSVEVLNNCPAAIFIPNAFTPNSDGINDVFSPVIHNVTSIYWSIIDRWGNIIYETNQLNGSWDGKMSDAYVPNDVYVFYLTYTGSDGSSGFKSGNVTLLR